jgi:hypothetical protein
MKLIPYGEIRLSDDPSVTCGLRIHINNRYGVRALSSRIEAAYIS